MPGNRAAVGRGGGAGELARWRRLALEATSEQDMLDAWAKLVECAKAGEPWAVHEFLDRTMGKAVAAPPELGPDPTELLARLWKEWARPAEDVYSDRVAALEAENRRLRGAPEEGGST